MSLVSCFNPHEAFRTREASTEYRRDVQVFLVQDPDLKAKIIEIVDAEIEATNEDRGRFSAVLSLGSDERFIEAFKDAFKNNKSNIIQAETDLNALLEWTATSRFLPVKDRPGMSSYESGVEVFFRGDDIYLTVPSAGHIRDYHENCQRVIAEMEAWVPPAGVVRAEIDLGNNPLGFPRIVPTRRPGREGPSTGDQLSL